MSKVIPAFFGHHKCGTTWIMKVIAQVFRHMGIKHDHFYSPKTWGYNQDNQYTLDKVVDDLHSDFIGYTSADLRYIGNIKKFRGVHVIRDPRDIVTSAYFSHLYSHPTTDWPELIEFRKKLEKMPKDKGFLANMKFTAGLSVDGIDLELFKSMLNWDYTRSNILEVKFEDMIMNPYNSFIQFFNHFGFIQNENLTSVGIIYHFVRDNIQKILRITNLRLKSNRIPDWYVLYSVYMQDFSRLTSGRVEGQENIKSHFRKGISGDWKNHFNQQHKKFFKDNYNDLLIKMGYEKNDNW